MMDKDKTKEQLISELVEIRQRVSELEALDTERRQMEKRIAAPKLKGQSRTILTKRSFSPLRILMITMVSIFLAEIFVMILLFVLPPISRPVEALVDGLLLTALIFPILYLVLFRPLLVHIDQHKRAQEVLAESEEKFRMLSEHSPNMIFINKNGRVVYANKMCEDITGHKREEFYSPDFDFLALIAPEHVDLVKVNFGKHMKGEEIVPYECTLITKEGKRIDVIEATALIPYEGEHAILRVITDITERKKMEEQLQHSRVLASLGEMTAGISHEVNNPLSSVLLYSEILLKSDVPRQARKDLKIIHNEAKRAASIMRDLLTYSRKLTPRMRRSNLHGILKKVLDMRRYQDTVHDINVSGNLLKGPLYVNGDSSQLTQVFLNLMLNAEESLQEHKGGKIKVTTEIDGEWAKISIADEGTGIPEDKLSQVFHPFFTTKKVGEGTGLGLSICYGIIMAHGGLIRAENNEMGGATFIVELPLAKTRRQENLRQKTEAVIT